MLVAMIVFVWVSVVRVAIWCVDLPASAVQTICPQTAVIQLGLAFIAQLLEFDFLLSLQVAADTRIFTLSTPALAKLIILAFVQAVDLMVEIIFQIAAGVCRFRRARGKLHRRNQKEGTKYEGISDPGAFQWSVPPELVLFGSQKNKVAAFDL